MLASKLQVETTMMKSQKTEVLMPTRGTICVLVCDMLRELGGGDKEGLSYPPKTSVNQCFQNGQLKAP